MTRTGFDWSSASQRPLLKVRISEDTLVVSLPRPSPVISWAAVQGGSAPRPLTSSSIDLRKLSIAKMPGRFLGAPQQSWDARIVCRHDHNGRYSKSLNQNERL